MEKTGFICSGIISTKIIRTVCFLLSALFSLYLNAQKHSKYIDISKIQFSVSLKDNRIFEFSDSNFLDNEIDKLIFDRTYSPESKSKTIFVKLSLSNSSDSTQQIYFSPGLYFTDLKIFRANDETEKYLPIAEKSTAGKYLDAGFILLEIQPKEKAVFFLTLQQLKSGAPLIPPRLINKNFIDHYTHNLSNKPISLITYMLSGFLLMMTFYSLIIFLQNSKPEFLYYSAYTFSITLLLFLKSYLINTSTIISYYFESYFDFVLEACIFIFYIAFIRKFLRTAQEHAILEKNLKAFRFFTMILIALFSITSFTANDFFISNIIEDATIFLFFVQGIYFIIYGIAKNDKLIGYLVIGQIIFIAFSILSFGITTTNVLTQQENNSLFNEPLFYFETGTLLELILFVTAIAQREKKELALQTKNSKHLKLEHERDEFEKKIAVIEAKSNERKRISADMHDELGSGLTAIRMMSEILKRKMNGNSLPEVEKISLAANNLLDKMDGIIWTMNSSNDSAENLIAYIRIYAIEFFESTPIDCTVSIPSSIPPVQINGDERKNLFLAVKESLNNIIKHSRACHAEIRISIEKKLIIEISDDGIGIDIKKLRPFGNGVCNIKKRMESIGGNSEIKNQNGTTVILSLNL